ncbi:hypothetical protein BTB_502p04770 (plasmid) [Bacillus thuringiensis Bt407]|uniref:Uncharacterized protein n=1 Tax=Bacillus thuringiensis T01-328 TaxID=1324966 RepID=A0AAN4KQK8_BACTU|nr:hypothetical protein BTB_502p04770 [Bacillus thuringiensis Bt407]ERI01042.1 hypothetical protein BTCBT_002597 [Bacillus thuringiensis T01-328]
MHPLFGDSLSITAFNSFAYVYKKVNKVKYFYSPLLSKNIMK